MQEKNDIDMMSEEQEKEKKREREESRRIAAGAEQRWASTMHKAFPSGTIEAAPPKKPEDGDNGATEASGYKPQLEPAPYGKFGAAPTTPQLVWSAEEAKDTKGAKEGEETGASGYKPR